MVVLSRAELLAAQKAVVRPKNPGEEKKKKVAPVGPHIGDPRELADRLNKKWNGAQVIDSLKKKLLDYETRHGNLDEGKIVHADKELQILQKVVEDGEGVMHMQPAELAALNVIQNGKRDFIDFSLDELSRFTGAKISGFGEGSFDWRAQGEAGNNPALTRSTFEHRVADNMTRHASNCWRPRGFTDLDDSQWWAKVEQSQAAEAEVTRHAGEHPDASPRGSQSSHGRQGYSQKEKPVERFSLV